jgi:hypothetical protein
MSKNYYKYRACCRFRHPPVRLVTFVLQGGMCAQVCGFFSWRFHTNLRELPPLSVRDRQVVESLP